SARPSILARRRRRVATRVEVHNEVSREYTVLDVYTGDRVGLLFTITNTLYHLWLEIHLAKITTMVEQVLDVFYVTDHEGRKIEDAARLEPIRHDLVQARALAAVRGFTRFLVVRGVLADDVLRHLRIRRPPARLPRALGTGEMGSLLAEPAESHCRGLRDRALLELLYACGLRVSEAISLRGAQVNLPAGFVTVLGKGGKERVVPLGRHARAALAA